MQCGFIEEKKLINKGENNLNDRISESYIILEKITLFFPFFYQEKFQCTNSIRFLRKQIKNLCVSCSKV